MNRQKQLWGKAGVSTGDSFAHSPIWREEEEATEGTVLCRASPLGQHGLLALSTLSSCWTQPGTHSSSSRRAPGQDRASAQARAVAPAWLSTDTPAPPRPEALWDGADDKPLNPHKQTLLCCRGKSANICGKKSGVLHCPQRGTASTSSLQAYVEKGGGQRDRTKFC